MHAFQGVVVAERVPGCRVCGLLLCGERCLAGDRHGNVRDPQSIAWSGGPWDQLSCPFGLVGAAEAGRLAGHRHDCLPICALATEPPAAARPGILGPSIGGNSAPSSGPPSQGSLRFGAAEQLLVSPTFPNGDSLG